MREYQFERVAFYDCVYHPMGYKKHYVPLPRGVKKFANWDLCLCGRVAPVVFTIKENIFIRESVVGPYLP